MFQAIGRGEIKALWVMGTNPAVSLPNADAVRAAMKKLDLLVISENVRPTTASVPARMCCCPRTHGARSPGPLPTPSAGFPASAVPAGAGRSESPTGGS
jgi:anaerobic selenocysteine-containing dehydrogenase